MGIVGTETEIGRGIGTPGDMGESLGIAGIIGDHTHRGRRKIKKTGRGSLEIFLGLARMTNFASFCLRVCFLVKSKFSLIFAI